LSKSSTRETIGARNLIIDVPWDRETIVGGTWRAESWQRYLGRGIAEEILRNGIEPLLGGAEPGSALS